MKISDLAIKSIFAILLSAGNAFPCDLLTASLGYCDVSILPSVKESDSRGTISKHFVWKIDDRNVGRKLTVCGYDTTAVVMGGNPGGQKPYTSIDPNVSPYDFAGPRGKERWRKLMAAVRNAVAQWTDPYRDVGAINPDNLRYSALEFDFGDAVNFRRCEDAPSSDVRIMFTSTSYWRGQLGTIGSDFAPKYGSSFLATVTVWQARSFFNAAWWDGHVRHEFGHILGFLHEMYNENWEGVCIKKFDEKMFLSDPFFKGIDVSAVKDTIPNEMEWASDPHDPYSVMSYALPARFFGGDSDCAMKENSALSPLDHAAFLTYYLKY